MPQQLSCPSPEALRRFLLGEIPEDELDECQDHLMHCDVCLVAVQSSQVEDTLIDAMRAGGTNGETEDEKVDALVGKLSSMHSSLGNSIYRIRTDAKSEVDTVLNDLEPAQKPGQLGQLSHYEVLEVIGQGGMGVVLKALDQKLKREVAIKVLSPALAGHSKARQRFVREAQAAAAVRNEHVVAIHAVEDESRLPYFVMEHIRGESLQQLLESKPLAPAEIIRIGKETARGLMAAHEQGLIHRDIKPANILLEEGSGHVKLTDFGLAHSKDDANLSQLGMVAGTPQFMSPEQASGSTIDHRADLFSLGSVLYTLCAGHPPFQANNTIGVLKQVCETEPEPLTNGSSRLPKSLIGVVSRLLKKDPEERYQSAAEVIAALDACNGSDTATPALTHFTGRLRLLSPFWRYAIAAGLLIGAVVLSVQIVVRIRDKDGRIQEVKVPEGGTAEIIENGLVVSKAPGGVPTSTSVRRFEGHKEPVHSLVFFADGQRVLSGGWDHKVRLWDVASGRELHCFDLREPGKNFAIYCVAVTRDGRRALAGSREGRAWLFDLEAGKVLHYCDHPKTKEHGGYGVNSVAFSPDGQQALLGSFDGIVRVWDVESWTELTRFKHPDRLWSVAWSEDSRFVLTAGSGSAPICLWDIKSPKQPRHLIGSDATKDGFWRAVFSVDAQLAASVGGDNRVRLWDITTLKELRTFVHPRAVSDACFTNGGKRLLTACQDGIIRLWDVASEKEIHRFAGHSQGVQTVAVSRDGRYAASAGHDGTVQLWEMPK